MNFVDFLDVIEVNKVLGSLSAQLMKKADQKDMTQFATEQSLINEYLCTENIKGRWKWASGSVLDSGLVPWEFQSINTLSDNFLWQKNSPVISVASAGLYSVRGPIFFNLNPFFFFSNFLL